MLTIFALNNAKEAARYYEDDNYYAKGSVEAIAATHWWGKGAEALGLNDYVDPERFIELLSGKIDQDTRLERIRHDGGVGHKPGYDLTFSAPKSVSMLAEIGKDFRIYDAHNKAVNAALEYLQSRVAQYRKTVDSHTKVELGNNLIVAKFRHDTSRSVDDTIDCQLHTHSVVVNAVKGQDGKWRSLFERPTFDFKMTGGMIYRSALAMELKRLGYQIEKTREDGLFEVAGFSREDIETFSKRRIKILEVMKENDLMGVHAAQEVTLNTRESKFEIDRKKLDEHWNARIKEAGIDIDSVVTKAEKRAKLGISEVIDKGEVADKALQYALDHLGERQSVFQEKDIIHTSLQYALGDISIEDIHKALTQFKEQEKVVFLGVHQHREIYTTPKVLEREQRIIEVMNEGKNEYDPIASKEATDLYIKEVVEDEEKKGFTPTDCQLKAIRFLARSTDKVVGVQGYAGTGKTTMLRSICRLSEAAGYSIRGSAPSASAADVLRGDTGISTETLSGLLLSLSKEKPGFLKKPEIIILDEASMASTHQMVDLMNQAERLNKRIFLVGDELQLPAVEAGSPFSLMQKSGLNTTYLTQVVRQEAKDIEWSVKETIHGDVGLALKAIGNEAFIEKRSDGEAFKNERSSVNVIENKPTRLGAISQSYLELDQKGRDDTIVLLGSNEDRQTVNEQIRDGLKEQGIIRGYEAKSMVLQSKGFTIVEKQHVYNYEIGDVVRFNKSYRSVGVKRFDYLTVIGIDQEKQELIFEKGGREVRWSPVGSAKSKGAAVEVFEQEERSLAEGDFIRWTQNRKNHDIYNTETAEVVSVRGDVARVKLRKGKIIEINLTESINSHWDYAWSSTVYAAQGKKARNVIAQLEGNNPNLSNYRSFYVTISRAVNMVHLYVDDLEKATRTIQEHTGEKSNASEFLTSHKEKQAIEKYIKKAYLKLDGNIHQYNSIEERLSKLATHYVESSSDKKAHLIATDFKDRAMLNALIRVDLKGAGRVTGEDINVGSLRKFNIRTSDDKMKLMPGMVIGFARGYKKYGVKKGDYYSVKGIKELEGKAILGNTKQENIEVDVAFLVDRQRKEVEVCKLDNLPLSSGDEIIWTKSYKKDGIVSGRSAVIREISKNSAVVELHNHKHITLDLRDPRMMHWQYGYAKSMSDKVPKNYEVGLAHLDERTKSPARIDAVFGAMGKASLGSHIYTHSKDYVINKLRLSADQNINLEAYSNADLDKAFYKKLTELDQSRKIVGKAWVSYFEQKKAGLDTTEVLRNALILDRAHAELANQVISDSEFNKERLEALGYDVSKLEKYAKKYEATSTLEAYQTSSGLLKLQYAHRIAGQIETFDKAINAAQIDKQTLLEQGWEYQRKIDRVKLTSEQRQSARIVDRYFEYSQQARSLWSRIYKSKDQGIKPELPRVAFANHVSRLRNQLASEIVKHPEKYADYTDRLHKKTKALIESHARKLEDQLKREAKRQLIANTKNWREVVSQDQVEYAKRQNIQYDQRKSNKIFWDKDVVLREAMPKAEAIISSLLTEEKNTRQSKGNKIVWGKKNGSVHFHTGGSKEGIVNDYERNIHGDLITFYAKSKGIDWYDALSEIAAIAGINPDHASIKEFIPAKEIQEKKQRAILKEQKRRESVKNLAKSTWDESQPIKGTLAETYLKKHRGADFDVNKLEVRFNPKAPVYTYKDDKLKVFDRKPAMIVAFRNGVNELTAVQCTYLDPATSNKDKNAKVVKMTVGSQWGSVGEIYKGEGNKIIIAEGAETAMSLVQTDPKATIYITGGNMQNVQHYDFLAEKHNTKEVHIAADNDLSLDAGSWKSMKAGSIGLVEKGIAPFIYQPEAIKGEKTDFNDVYKRYGAFEVKKQFIPKYTISLNENNKEQSEIVTLVNEKSASKEEKQPISDYRIPDIAGSEIKAPEQGKDEKTLGERE